MTWRLGALIRLQIYLKQSNRRKEFINISGRNGVCGFR